MILCLFVRVYYYVLLLHLILIGSIPLLHVRLSRINKILLTYLHFALHPLEICIIIKGVSIIFHSGQDRTVEGRQRGYDEGQHPLTTS